MLRMINIISAGKSIKNFDERLALILCLAWWHESWGQWWTGIDPDTLSIHPLLDVCTVVASRNLCS